MCQSPFLNMLNRFLMFLDPEKITRYVNQKSPFLSRCHAPDFRTSFDVVISRERRILRSSRLRTQVLLTLSFQIWYFLLILIPKSRDMTKSKHHLKSIDLVEISRSVVESSKMDPSRSHFGRFGVSNEFC